MTRKWMSAPIVMVCIQLILATVLTGCNTFGSGSRGDTFIDPVFSADQEEAKERLHSIVREHIQTGQSAADAHRAPVVRRRPYYLKEYSIYPDGAEGFTVDFREIDSRIRPLMAEVVIGKVRYSTRMHRKHDRAVSDMDFLRDTGVETLVFELRSGRWVRTGAVFDAETTEEQVSGEWIPRREETKRIIPSEERPGWFKRVWLRVRGEKE